VSDLNMGTSYTPEDIESSKVMAGLAYILFFLPLVVCPDSPYGRYHANQGLLLLLLGVGGSIILGIIPIIGWLLLPIFALVVFVFAIMGLINGFTGKAKPLPLIGKYQLRARTTDVLFTTSVIGVITINVASRRRGNLRDYLRFESIDCHSGGSQALVFHSSWPILQVNWCNHVRLKGKRDDNE
jgi:uncharacterized membrane protein